MRALSSLCRGNVEPEKKPLATLIRFSQTIYLYLI